MTLSVFDKLVSRQLITQEGNSRHFCTSPLVAPCLSPSAELLLLQSAASCLVHSSKAPATAEGLLQPSCESAIGSKQQTLLGIETASKKLRLQGLMAQTPL